jgi:hypothetical protein
MARWIAFDQETTSLLRSNLAQGTRIDTLRRGPVDYALAKPGAVVTVLPAQGDSGPGIAVFRRARPVAAQRPPVEERPPVSQPPAVVQQLPRAAMPPGKNLAATRASGFLGLTDEPVFEEEAVEEKRGWWRRLWEE